MTPEEKATRVQITRHPNALRYTIKYKNRRTEIIKENKTGDIVIELRKFRKDMESGGGFFAYHNEENGVVKGGIRLKNNTIKDIMQVLRFMQNVGEL